MKNTRIRAGFRVATGVAALALPLTVAGTAFAGGDNGDVKVHNTTTSVTDQRDEPKVCTFYLDGFNFDPGQQIHWEIDAWADNDTDKGTKVLEGTLTAGPDQNVPSRTADQPKLKDGQYKLFWNFVGENGAAKHKVFKVECAATPPTSPPISPTPTSPGGGHSSPGTPATSSSIKGSTGGSTGGTTGGTTGGSTGGTPTTPAPSATTPAATSSTSPSTGSLAHTGADGSVLYLAAGAVALGGGGFALRRYAMARGKA